MFQTMSKKIPEVRKPLACALHEIANIIGPERAEVDLIPILENILQDHGRASPPTHLLFYLQFFLLFFLLLLILLFSSSSLIYFSPLPLSPPPLLILMLLVHCSPYFLLLLFFSSSSSSSSPSFSSFSLFPLIFFSFKLMK